MWAEFIGTSNLFTSPLDSLTELKINRFLFSQQKFKGYG